MRRRRQIREQTRVEDSHAILPDAWLSHRLARWNLQIDTAVLGKAPPDRLTKILRLLFGLTELPLQDFAHFLLQKVAMTAARTRSLRFGSFVEFADGQTCPDISDLSRH